MSWSFRIGVFWACLPILGLMLNAPMANGEEETKGKNLLNQGKRSRLDRFGDLLPEGAIARLGTVRLKHVDLDCITCLVYSRDGKMLAAAGARPRVVTNLGGGLLGAKNKKPAKHRSENAMIAQKGPCCIRLCHAASGRTIHFFEDRELEIRCLAFSPDGKRLASAGLAGGFRLWDTATGKNVKAFPTKGHAFAVAFSPNGRILALAEDNCIHCWDVHRDCKLRTLKGHRQRVVCLAFAPDGKSLVSGSWDKTIRVWSLPLGKENRPLHTPGWVFTVAWAPNGKTIASGGEDGKIRLWSMVTGKQRRCWQAHETWVHNVAFSADGQRLCSTGWDYECFIWSVAGGKELHRFGIHARGHPAATLSPGGNILAAANRETQIDLRDIVSGKRLFVTSGHQQGVAAVAYSPDGKTLASGSFDGTVGLWSAAAGIELQKMTIPGADMVRQVVFSPNGQILAIATRRHKIYLWHLTTGQVLRPLPNLARLSKPDRSKDPPRVGLPFSFPIAFSPDGKIVAAAYDTQGIYLWATSTGKRIKRIPQEGPGGAITSVSFSRDGQVLACTRSKGPVQFWNVQTGRPTFSSRLPVYDLSVTLTLAKGKSVVIAPAAIPAYFWNGFVPTNPFKILERAEDEAGGQDFPARYDLPVITGAASFSSDGKTLALADWMREEVSLCEVMTGGEIRRYKVPAGVCSVAVAPDGKTLASGCDRDATILIWDATGILHNGRLPRKRLRAEELAEFWQDLAETDAAIADCAAWNLVARAEQAVPWIRKHCPGVASSTLARLIEQLDDKRYAMRARATKALERVVDQAEPALRRSLRTTTSVEVYQRVEKLRAKVPFGRMRNVRAVKVLERIGTRAAQEVLAELARGTPKAWLTQEARAALTRLGH
jgi:WD40 repeat protein